MTSKQVVSVILGGGAGSRLYPLTATRSKPAVPIAGKYRLVDIPISNCINSGINRMFVLTQYNSASLNKHIKNSYQFSSFSNGFVDILAAEQTPDSPGWFQGTADAVRQSFKHIEKHDFDYVLILSGDQLYQMDLAAMIDNHKAAGADITIATIPVTAREATEFGLLKTDANNSITSFIEKPAADLLPNWMSDTGQDMRVAGRDYLASMGIYILPDAIDKYKVISYQYGGYWTDIGNIYSFFEANLALTMDIPPFNLFDSKQMVYTRARMLPPAKISGTTLTQSLVSEGCIVHAKSLHNSVIGIRSRIGAGTVLENCYIMGSDFYETIEEIANNFSKGIPKVGIGDNCVLKNVIADKDCRIGDNVKITGGNHLIDGDHELYTIKEGIVVIKKGAVIADGFEL
jgi:glucose-1-phosphate adenylyltransferase